MSRFYTLSIGLVVCLGLLTSACATRSSGLCGDWPKLASSVGDASALAAQGDSAWENRADETQLRASIKAWSDALAIEPNRPDLRVKLARAHYFLADSHIEMDDTRPEEERQKEIVEHFKQGANQAELALGQSYPGFRSAYCTKQNYKSQVQALDEKALGGMYWYATNLGKYALKTSIIEALTQKDRIKAMMTYIKEVEPGFFHHAADRYFGAFFTKIPFPKGDLPKSAKHFEASASGSPHYLATKVLYAKMNALKQKDAQLYKRLLDEVVSYDLDAYPELKPENLFEQKKAQAELEEFEFLFPDAAVEEAPAAQPATEAPAEAPAATPEPTADDAPASETAAPEAAGDGA